MIFNWCSAWLSAVLQKSIFFMTATEAEKQKESCTVEKSYELVFCQLMLKFQIYLFKAGSSI